jgi:Ca-activated chloride channel family protein
MLTFVHPWVLLLLPLVPLPVWWWLRRRRPAMRFPDTAMLAALPPGRSRVARWGGATLRAAALVLLILALAGPRIPDLNTRIATEGIALSLVVDVSGSMAEADFLWDSEPMRRLDAVKRVLRLFLAGGESTNAAPLEGRHDDLVGLVVFATRPETVCPLTLSHSTLLKLLDEQEPKKGPDESQTNIGDAIAWGLYRLEAAGPRRKVLILLTDGEHNVPAPALRPRQAAQLAAGLRVPIYVIDSSGLRSTLEPVPAVGEVDTEDVLQAVASLSKGRYFRAPDTQTLLTVCQEIDRLERNTIQSFLYRRYYEIYPWCGLAGFVFLIGVHVLELTAWRRAP